MPREFNIAPHYISNLRDNEFIVGPSGLLKQFPRNKVVVLDYRAHYDSEIKRVLRECRKYPDNKYYFTKVYTGKGGYSAEEVAPSFLAGLWSDNVFLPEEFIDVIAHKALTDDKWRQFNRIEGEHLSDLEYWEAWKNTKKYEPYLVILPSDVKKSLRKAIIAIRQGKNLDGSIMPTLCQCLEAAKKHMVANGNIPQMKRESGTGKFLLEALEGKGDEHIGRFYYTIFGIASPAKHLEPANPNAINYRERLEEGKEQILATSLVYMLLDVLQWCATLPKNYMLTHERKLDTASPEE